MPEKTCEKLCESCWKNPGVGKLTRHLVEYQGIKIMVPRSGKFCSECIQKFLEVTKDLIKEAGVDTGLVTIQDGKYKINWQVYVEQEQKAGNWTSTDRFFANQEGKIDPKEIRDKMTGLLQWLKILSWGGFYHNCGWGIEGSGPFYIGTFHGSEINPIGEIEVVRNLNPEEDLLFARKEDAIEYARSKLADVPFDWYVRKYGKVVYSSKEAKK